MTPPGPLRYALRQTLTAEPTMKCAGPCSKNLIGLKRELNRWRRSQARRTALPEAMWQAAAAAARSEGVGAVARILRLD